MDDLGKSDASLLKPRVAGSQPPGGAERPSRRLKAAPTGASLAGALRWGELLIIQFSHRLQEGLGSRQLPR